MSTHPEPVCMHACTLTLPARGDCRAECEGREISEEGEGRKRALCEALRAGRRGALQCGDHLVKGCVGVRVGVLAISGCCSAAVTRGEDVWVRARVGVGLRLGARARVGVEARVGALVGARPREGRGKGKSGGEGRGEREGGPRRGRRGGHRAEPALRCQVLAEEARERQGERWRHECADPQRDRDERAYRGEPHHGAWLGAGPAVCQVAAADRRHRARDAVDGRLKVGGRCSGLLGAVGTATALYMR